MYGVPEYVPGMFFDTSNLDKLHSTSTMDKLSEYCELHRDEMLTYLSFSASQIAGRTSFKSMWAILKKYDNSYFLFPGRLTKNTKIVRLIGMEEAQKFTAGYFSGERMAVSGFRSAVKDVNRHIRDTKALELYEDGLSFYRIAIELSTSRTTIRNCLRQMNKIPNTQNGYSK